MLTDDTEIKRIDSLQNGLLQLKERLSSNLENLSKLKDRKEDYLVLAVDLVYKEHGIMNKITILAPDGYTSSVIIPIVNRMQSKGVFFDIQEATIDYMPNDADFRFFCFHNPSDDYVEEIILHTELNLYASSEYLNLHGEPKELFDLDEHVIIRPQKSDVLTKIGKVEYLPIDYKHESLNVDKLTSLYAMGESGLGIICATDHSVALRGLELEKINKLGDTCQLPFVFSTHKKIKDKPIAKQFRQAVMEVLG